MNDESKPRAYRGDPGKVGGCNSCSARQFSSIWVVRLHSLEVRLCDACAKALMAQLAKG